MHDCLKIDELLAAILQDDVLLSVDVLAMSLACKTFHEPAMDRLWHTVDSELNLLRLLPDGIVRYRKTRGRDWQMGWTVTNIPAAEDWDRFKKYANRIRKLTWDTAASERIDPTLRLSLLDVMKLQYGNTAAFPNLQILAVAMNSVTSTEQWTVLTQPGLRTIATPSRNFAAVKRNDRDGYSIVRHLHYFNRSIVSIYFDCSVKLGRHAMKTMAQLPCLRKLAIVVDTSFERIDKLPGLTGIAFPALRFLQVAFMKSLVEPLDCSGATSFLQLLSSVPLKTLDVRLLDIVPTKDSLCAMLQAMAQFSATLKRCEVDVSTFWMPLHDGDKRKPAISFSAILAPLLSLAGSLTSLNLGGVALDIGRRHLHVFLNACRGVRMLHLGDSHLKTRSNLRLSDFAVIAACCPRLFSLALPMPHATPEDDGADYTESAAPSTHGLQRLQLSTRSIGATEDTSIVYAAARRVFPNALELQHYY
ncbi:hypothetical protein PHLGIDRAFT_148842 [Phlebiopsis gigantea 11061_1 CR5-6]|uniref:F-box domain-containing protein n=1 Tax=Phlebiopsis gigantea (strain 11061_1 CR5-6) TaxID=745531 RepID=A0A0C3S5B9_PHLG1|nr:hypothetical protein PHLGIDRAFT_148842 [Phlebiopsis gigantea 11061_1 CR5-6]